MAGLGIKKWAIGSVLTSSDLNGYVGEQVIAVFATVAARTAAYGGANEPELSEGMFSYVIDSDGSGNPAFQYYDGSVWVDIATAIAPGSITNEMLASNAVTADKIANGTVIAADIATDAVTTDKILNSAVNASKLATDAVTTDKIIDDAVTAAKLADTAVTPGTYSLSTITVDQQGRITSASTGVVDTSIPDNSITSSKILDGTLLNADISASAGISYSKLATMTSGSILLGNASNTPTVTAVSGDVTINSSGVTAIGSGVIVDADISSSAAMDIGKIADATISTKTSSYTLVLSDKNKIIEMNASASTTLTVPTNASEAFPVGSQVMVVSYGSGRTQIVGASGVDVRGTPGTWLRTQYSSAVLIKRATNEWYVLGDVLAS